LTKRKKRAEREECSQPRGEEVRVCCVFNEFAGVGFWAKNGGGKIDRREVALVFGLKMGVGGVGKCFKV